MNVHSVCSKSFPSVTVMRFIHDPLARDLASVFTYKSTKGGESALELYSRMVPVIYGRGTATLSSIRVIEALKKGFEFRDLQNLPDRQIQSSVRIKANDGLRYYRESFERFDTEHASMQSSLSKYIVRMFLRSGDWWWSANRPPCTYLLRSAICKH